MSKQERLAAILDLVKVNRVTSHEVLRELLERRGIEVTQATLSRDIRELRLVKVRGAQGVSHYRLPEEWGNKPPLSTLLPILFLSAEGSENLVVIRTMNGGAAGVAISIDWGGLAGGARHGGWGRHDHRRAQEEIRHARHSGSADKNRRRRWRLSLARNKAQLLQLPGSYEVSVSLTSECPQLLFSQEYAL